MPCFKPLTGFYGREVNPATGKRAIVFHHTKTEWIDKDRVQLPCGQCIGCRLERSRQWAMRCMHEKALHDNNHFVTLTYSPEKVPSGGTLVKRDLQLFMKRLRKAKGNGIRFYACGEYGGQNNRPHYHIILFNCALDDLRCYRKSKGGENLYNSDLVSRLWPHGFNVVGDVTFESCAYVARYICDKITGDAAETHYVNAFGEVLEPEFTNMSRRPGIGTGWFEKFGDHAYKLDSVVMRGRKVRPPRFYDLKIDAKRLAVLKKKRRTAAMKFRDEQSPERRRVREQCARLAMAKKSEV